MRKQCKINTKEIIWGLVEDVADNTELMITEPLSKPNNGLFLLGRGLVELIVFHL